MSFFSRNHTDVNPDDWTITKKTIRTTIHENFSKMKNLKVDRWALSLSCYDCDSTSQHYDVTRFKYVFWRRTMHEWVLNIHYQTWIAQGQFINMIRTPSKQWGVCNKFMTASMNYACCLETNQNKAQKNWCTSWPANQTERWKAGAVLNFWMVVQINILCSPPSVHDLTLKQLFYKMISGTHLWKNILR